MLAYAAAWDGQSSVALQAARGLSRVANDVSMHAFVLVRFGRFDDAASLGPRPSSDIHAGMWDFAQGYAALRGGKSEVARVALDRLRDSASTSKASFKFHKARSLLGVVAAILEGEIHRASGGLGAAIASFERSVSLQDSLIIDDPEPLPFAARHWLGAALLEATQYADAERVYREDLRRHPHNGWSLVGLRDALKGRGRRRPRAMLS
jgi:tetratricopeptide (TPR) repeat protein